MSTGANGPIEAVIFDLFGTLAPAAERLRRLDDQARVAALLGVPSDQFSELARASFTERATGVLGDGVESLRALAERLGGRPSPAALAEAAALRLVQVRRELSPRPGATAVLGAVRARGHRIGLISDCGPEVPEIWTSLPFAPLIDATVFSVEAGHRKPHPLLYETACRALGVAPAACLYVGDGDSCELTGAGAAGMRAVRLRAPESRLDGWEHYDPDLTWTGPEIGDLDEVLAWLDGVSVGAGDGQRVEGRL